MLSIVILIIVLPCKMTVDKIRMTFQKRDEGRSRLKCQRTIDSSLIRYSYLAICNDGQTLQHISHIERSVYLFSGHECCKRYKNGASHYLIYFIKIKGLTFH